MAQPVIAYTKDVLDALEKAFTPQRLSPYKIRAKNNLEKALDFYIWNTQVGQALYAPLQTLEVAMRNSINRELVAKFSDKWYENKTPVLFDEKQFEKITSAIKRYDKGGPVPLNHIVSDLSFGFWSNLIDHKMYDELWKQSLHKAFPNRPKGTKRSNAAIPCTRLNTLRNRIAHHEAIFNRDLQTDYDLIIELTAWICPLTSSWSKSATEDYFKQVLASKPIV